MTATPPIVYRPAHPHELSLLAELKTRVYGGASMAAWSRRWSWQFVDHPGKPADAASNFLLGELEGHVVGGIGWMPTALTFDGKEHPAAFACDLFIDPGTQGHGLGKALAGQIWPRFPVSLWMNFGPAGARSYETRKFAAVAPVNYQVLLLDPGSTLASRGRGGVGGLLGWTRWPAGALVALRSRRAKVPPGVVVDDVPAFGGEFDRFREERIDPALVTPRRDSRYLQWRYHDSPFGPYRVRAARRGGKLKGFVVYRSRDRRGRRIGTVPELEADPRIPGLAEALLGEAIRDLVRERLDFVRAFPTDPASRRVFRRLGFIDSRRTPYLYVSPGALDRFGLPRAGARWRMSLGDSDLDFS